jgi:3-hydroxybutyryl-CoA dehydrogenase
VKEKNMDARYVNTVVVVGGGVLGQGIAQSFAEAGLTVKIVDLNNDVLDKCIAQIEANLNLFQKNQFLKESVAKIKARLIPVLTQDLMRTVQDCEFIIEVIPENLELKKKIFAQLDSCDDKIIIASNTSSFTIAQLTEGCRSADRFVGLHYFNPGHIMPLVEVHFGPKTRQDVLETALALMKRIGKKPILIRKEIAGFIINRLQVALLREAIDLVSKGIATPEDIDEAYKASIGIRFSCIGLFEYVDWLGLDFTRAVIHRFSPLLCNDTVAAPILASMIESENRGAISGKGWFDWRGSSRENIIDDQNKRLLPRYALYKELEQVKPLYKTIESGT